MNENQTVIICPASIAGLFYSQILKDGNAGHLLNEFRDNLHAKSIIALYGSLNGNIANVLFSGKYPGKYFHPAVISCYFAYSG